MPDNLSKVQQAFRILHPLLAGYVAQELSHEYKDSWWQEVLMTLSDQSRDLPDAGERNDAVYHDVREMENRCSTSAIREDHHVFDGKIAQERERSYCYK